MARNFDPENNAGLKIKQVSAPFSFENFEFLRKFFINNRLPFLPERPDVQLSRFASDLSPDILTL